MNSFYPHGFRQSVVSQRASSTQRSALRHSHRWGLYPNIGRTGSMCLASWIFAFHHPPTTYKKLSTCPSQHMGDCPDRFVCSPPVSNRPSGRGLIAGRLPCTFPLQQRPSAVPAMGGQALVVLVSVVSEGILTYHMLCLLHSSCLAPKFVRPGYKSNVRYLATQCSHERIHYVTLPLRHTRWP